MVQVYLFDLGGTLIHIDMRLLSEQAAALVGGPVPPPDVWRRAEWRAHGILDRNVPDLEPADFRGAARCFFGTIWEGVGLPMDATFDRWLDWFLEESERHSVWRDLDPEAQPVLQELSRRGHRIGVVSNNDGRSEEQLVETGLRPFVEAVFDSSIVGISKPDPRILQHAVDEMGAEREACVYVGDFYHIDAACAQAAGLGAILVDPFDDREGFPCPRIRRLGDLIRPDGR